MQNEMWLSVKQLEARGLGSARTIWRRVEQKTFPAPVRLSAGMTRWRLSDVLAYECDPSSYAGVSSDKDNNQPKVIEADFANSLA